jgi:anti-anti-sigma regulatory factor/HAMP domain-containing protein
MSFLKDLIKRSFYAGSIRTRLLTFFIILVLVPTAATGLTSALLGWQNGRQRVVNQLELAAKFKTSEIQNWMDRLTMDLADALNEGDAIDFARYLLQWHQDSAGQPFSPEDYPSEVIGDLESRLRRYIERTSGLEHLLVVSLEGNVIASTLKPRGAIDPTTLDFQRGLQGSYMCFPSSGQVKAVVGIPIFKQGAGPDAPEPKVMGVLIGQASSKVFNDLMRTQEELGESGETYLVNQDYAPITALRFEDVEKVETRGTRRAIEDHEDGFGFYKDYRGRPVVGVYRWLSNMGIALLAEQDRAEAFGTIYQTLGINIGVAILAVLSAVVAATFIARSIATPLINLSETATRIAKGELDVNVPEATQAEPEGLREDEIGTLARAFNRMTTRLREMLRSEEVRRAELEREIAEREKAEAEREQLLAEQASLQQEVIEAQRQALRDLSTPIIPVMEVPGRGSILVMPLIGSIDTMRAQDIMRSLLAGISEHRAGVVILDITGVPIVDSGVAGHLNKTIQAARLKGTRVIITGISDAVAEAVVDLGIDWREVETLSDLRTGLIVALDRLGIQLTTKT